MKGLACANITEEVISSMIYTNYDVIGIDEGQFFSDVKSLINLTLY